jgi:DNA-binding transcriptional regulator YiaG
MPSSSNRDNRTDPSENSSSERSISSDTQNYKAIDTRKSSAEKKFNKKYTITEEDIRKHFNCSQKQAASLLGVSVSTLKRRFYALGLGHKWPYPLAKKQTKKRSLSYILNKKNVENAKFLDNNTLNHLVKAFALKPLESMQHQQQPINVQRYLFYNVHAPNQSYTHLNMPTIDYNGNFHYC